MSSAASAPERSAPLRLGRLRSLAAALWADVWGGASRLERRCIVVGLALMVSGAAHVVVFAVRGGSWDGPVSFRKAVTFGLAFGLTVITVAWVQRSVMLPDRLRRILLLGFVVACVVEVALVTMQAWRGVPSHFNRDDGFDSAVSSILAAGGFVTVAVSAATAVAALRRPVADSPVVTLAVRAGYVGFLLALAVGAAMIARGVSIENTGSAEQAYHHAGSLKPAHADTMHAILVLPLTAWLLEHGRWPGGHRLRLLQIAVAGYGVVAAVVLYESIRSIDPLAPGVVSVVSALGVAALVAVAVAALVRAVRTPDAIDT